MKHHGHPLDLPHGKRQRHSRIAHPRCSSVHLLTFRTLVVVIRNSPPHATIWGSQANNMKCSPDGHPSARQVRQTGANCRSCAARHCLSTIKYKGSCNKKQVGPVVRGMSPRICCCRSRKAGNGNVSGVLAFYAALPSLGA
jgi:hypothetical protein